MTSITKNSFVALAIKPGLLISMLSLGLVGCEAPLNLEGVAQEMAKPVRRTDQFQNVAANKDAIVAVGNDGLFLTSPINNIQWTRRSVATKHSIIDVAACPDQSFVALGIDKKVWRSTDNGASWSPSQLPTAEEVLDLTCAPDNSTWVVGSFSTIINSKDQGLSWSETTLNEDAMLTGIQFIDESTPIITGEFGIVVRSDDNGKNWNIPEYIPNDFYVQGSLFLSKETGWVAGLSGQILYTNDGGQTWTKQQTPTESPLYGFYQAGSRLFAFGDHGTLLEYTGATWQAVPSQGKPVYLRAAQTLDNGKLLLAGGAGSLFALDIHASDNTQISQN